MDAHTPSVEPVPFHAPDAWIGDLSPALVARMLGVAGDVALVMDTDGVIRDLALGSQDLADDGAETWLGKTWSETVRDDSRGKVAEMLADPAGAAARWRQLNQLTQRGEVPVRWLAFPLGEDRGLVALGRDLRANAQLQQRLVQMQQTAERERLRHRQVEARYRLLFTTATRALLIVDAASRTVIEANPAADRLLGRSGLVGKPVQQLVAAADRDRLLAFLGAVSASDEAQPLSLRLGPQDVDCTVTGVMFRESRGAFILLRLVPVDEAAGRRATDELMEQVPDPFVLTDEAGLVRACNSAFLELTGYGRADDVVGQPLSRLIGRPGVDPGLMASQLAEHGFIRHFPTLVRTRFGEQLDVEVSAVRAVTGLDSWVGYTLRTIERPGGDTAASRGSPRSVEELTELVGRMSLKDIVRESTDLIERLCIEAALKCADNNRASAAEILGLSRQGLYLKLHRHGLARDTGDDRPS